LKTARTHFGELLFPLTASEKLDHVLCYPDKSADDVARDLIEPFVFRLYIANQLAEEYTYLKPEHTNIVVPIIDFPTGSPLPLPALLATLESLAYNIITNGGNTFLGVKDDEKLDRIIDRLRRELLPR
jgi:hypothetical protein